MHEECSTASSLICLDPSKTGILIFSRSAYQTVVNFSKFDRDAWLFE